MITDLLLVSVGNTRTRIAEVTGLAAGLDAIQPARVVDNGPGLAAAVREAAAKLPAESSRIVMASVNGRVADPLAEALGGPGTARLVRLTVDSAGMKIPMQTGLTPPLTVGADRLLAALGAYTRSGEACVVIDAGTAVTVDFVDAHGIFQGGVIAPGLAMQLRALHEGTAQLPKVEPPRTSEQKLPEGAWGKTTAEAMLLGCASSIRGLARLLIDKNAELTGAYPRVIATGGDSPLLFERDELIEHIVPDLVLIGMLAAWRGHHPKKETEAMAEADDDGDDE